MESDGLFWPRRTDRHLRRGIWRIGETFSAMSEFNESRPRRRADAHLPAAIDPPTRCPTLTRLGVTAAGRCRDVEEHRTSRFLRTLTYFQAVKDLDHALLASASIERTCSSGRDIGIGSIVAFGQLGMPDAGAVLELDVSCITGDTLFSRYPPCCG
jgi:hypothetical protein